MSQYTASIPPDGQVKPEIREFLEKFYAISDDPSANEQHARSLTKDGKLIMGPTEVNGYDGRLLCPVCSNVLYNNQRNADILKFRKGMWEKVAKRSHHPLQIYAFGAGSDDVMLHGTVSYELKDGKKTSTAWAAKAHFTKEDGELKMDMYQVFLVRDIFSSAYVRCC